MDEDTNQDKEQDSSKIDLLEEIDDADFESQMKETIDLIYRYS